MPEMPVVVAGVDGCRAGWIAVLRTIRDKPEAEVRVVEHIAELIANPQVAVLAVDMPIGLPEFASRGGRGPERAVRPLLGERQSSVFSVPSRAAVYCEDYRLACTTALHTSEPPRKVSKQAFHLFPRIREIDRLMSPELEGKVYEVHPEIAYWRLNGERPMSLPKKVQNRPNGPGLDERRDLLVGRWFDSAFFDQPPPKGADRDDLIDAAACSVIAERIFAGNARPFPADFQRDARGLRMAIWA